MRLGVIDCGTNTFHLLVTDVDLSGRFSQVHRERRYVRIGQEGLDKIGAAPFKRGIDCLADYKEIIQHIGVEKLKVFGTEALRRASNGVDFIRSVEQKTGIQIQMITGEEEARLIHLGVMKAIPSINEKGLIMDIGGGSVEFIIADDVEVYWSKSFPIGAQVLYTAFHQDDPIPPKQITALQSHLEQVLAPLNNVLKKHTTPILIGASGSFEVVESMSGINPTEKSYSIIPVNDFYKMHQLIVPSSLADRYAMKDLPDERVDLIVVAFLLIDFILQKTAAEKIITSAYAMKEGILSEMMKI